MNIVIKDSKEWSYNEIKKQNLSSVNFYIEKAEFRIISQKEEKTGLGTIKFITPDRYLISIKSNTGIEIARIYLTDDSVMLNDRINKKLYYGSGADLKNKYGLTTSILPVILGDYINEGESDSSNMKCLNGELKITGVVRNKKIKYVIDCFNGKSLLTVPEDVAEENEMKMRYSDFFEVNGINTPGKIEISDNISKTTIEIKIERIIVPWDGKIDFIPGKQYEKIRLL